MCECHNHGIKNEEMNMAAMSSQTDKPPVMDMLESPQNDPIASTVAGATSSMAA